MRKLVGFCVLYFVMGAVGGASVVLHFTAKAGEKWLAQDREIFATWKDTSAKWQAMATECQAKFAVATVLYEPRPADSMQFPIAGGALSLSVGLAGASGDLVPAWYIPAQVEPRAAVRGQMFQWVDMDTGANRGSIQLAPAARSAAGQ